MNATRFAVAPLCLVAAVLLFAATPGFLTLGNASSIAMQMWVLALLAVGQMFAVASRGFDISVGAVAALSSTVGALAANAFGLPGLLLGAAAGLACGTLNGWLIGRLAVPPIVATLGTLVGMRGVALLLTADGQAVPLADGTSDGAAQLAFEPAFGLPPSAWAALALVAAAAWLLDRSVLGRRILMLGSCPESAHLVGLDTGRTALRAYQLCGLFAGFAGVLITVRAGTGLPTEGTGMELQAIAAAVIGGTALSGGVARVWPVVAGAAFIQVLLTGLNLSGVPPFLAQVAIGAMIIGAGLLEQALRSSRLALNLRSSP